MQLIKTREKSGFRIYRKTITEKIFCDKNSVIEIEYQPNHRPSVKVFIGGS